MYMCVLKGKTRLSESFAGLAQRLRLRDLLPSRTTWVSSPRSTPWKERTDFRKLFSDPYMCCPIRSHANKSINVKNYVFKKNESEGNGSIKKQILGSKGNRKTELNKTKVSHLYLWVLRLGSNDGLTGLGVGSELAIGKCFITIL